jgi:hypothetical protein
MSIDDAKILHAVLDPRWKVGKLRIDNAEHIFITVQLPDNTNITWLVPRDQAQMMGKALMDLANSA